MLFTTIARRNALVYRRTWRGSLFTNFLQPTLFLLSMGLGVGSLVDRGGAAIPGGVPFLAFLAPGLLAGACMQTAAFESSWPVLGKITWQHNYEAILATPVRVGDIICGELVWLALRLTTVATTFMIVMVAFGVPRSPLAVVAIPAAVLTGLAFAAPVMAYAASPSIRMGTNFNALFRFVITPLFLFSGVFFPISRLPGPLQELAMWTPLYHGVALTRGLTLGTIGAADGIVHVSYLAAMLGAGIAAAMRTFDRKLLV